MTQMVGGREGQEGKSCDGTTDDFANSWLGVKFTAK